MKTEKYTEQKKRLPETGKHIIGRKENDNMVIYQAFNSQIGDYAIKHQQFGGSAYSFNRMSWIKPGFLWMMYRAGWSAKHNQERILAITLPINYFESILKEATLTSFDKNLFSTEKEWKAELNTEVRLQWDPDHDPFGNKQERKAIQIGMKGSILKKFCTEWIKRIEDITDFVKEEHEKVLSNKLADLNVPYEEVIHINDEEIKRRIGLVID
ncbi:MAG TPA: DUF4291 domain-containing protein [Puia sp.]|nr:DUF4291 domain-containing protein [Puia sp.]